MAGRTYFFDPPDRFVAGAVGEPGHRTFFLQAAKGRAVLTVALEKVQVALLAERIGAIAADTAGESERDRTREVLAPAPSLREPIVEAFRVGSMTLVYDEEGHRVTVEAQEVGDPAPDDDDDPREMLRVRMPLDDAVRFAESALQVVAAGRLPCPLCGEPLDPQGHICVRRNGYVM
jgi:uncharacterized repeat protein (TIGR03847 family)